MDLGLTDRRFIVTGASKGLGFATAAALAGEGARVLVASRSEEQVRRATAEIGLGSVGVACDLNDRDAPERLLSAADELLGGVDGAFVSHGGPPASGALDLDDDKLAAAVTGSLVAPIRFVRELALRLGAGGSIVVLTSMSSVEPLGGLVTSNLTRPGMWGYVKSLADEVAPKGVRVNCILPGRFATDRMLDVYRRSAETAGRDVESVMADNERHIPLRRLGDPAELGRVAAFLLSGAASYVTGAAWAVDGGAIRGL